MEKVLVDLGGGDKPFIIDGYTTLNVDVRKPANLIEQEAKGIRFLESDLISEKFPLEIKSESVSIVRAYDLLEHIPTVLYIPALNEQKRHILVFPRVNLMNEVWRVLEKDGVFDIFVPYFERTNPHFAWAQDPTHVDVPWTIESFNYFSNKPEWERLQKLYNITARFQIKEIKTNPWNTHLFVTLQK